MHQIKIIKSDYLDELEKEVNAWLAQNSVSVYTITTTNTNSMWVAVVWYSKQVEEAKG